MDSSIIAVRVANGSFVPVMDTSGKTRRRLVLTTIRDQQTSVKIDLYRGSDEEMGDAHYIGTLMIENIDAAPKGEADIALLLGVDDSGNLNAMATDKTSGEYQSLSVSLDADAEAGGYDLPDFELSDEELTLEDLSMDEDEMALDESAASLSLDDVDLEDDPSMDIGDESGTDTLAAVSPDEEEPPAGDGLSLEEELSLDDEFSLDEPSDEVTDEPAEEPVADLDDSDLTIDDDDLSLPEEATGEPEATEERDEESLAGLESFSEESVALDSSLADEELEEVDSEEAEAEFATDELPDLDDGMVEADLGDEDFTFDEVDETESGEAVETVEADEDNLFEQPEGPEKPGTETGDADDFDASDFGDTEFDASDFDDSDFGDAGLDESEFEETASEGFEDDLSPDEFDRLDSSPPEPATADEYGAEAAPLAPRRSNAIIFVGYLILSLAALGVLTYLVFRLLEGPPAPPLQASLPLLIGGIPLRRRRGRRKKAQSSR